MAEVQDRPRRSFSEWLSPLVHLSNNPISLIGVVMVTTAGILWLFLLPSLVRGGDENPYQHILTLLILPGLFFAGLVLIPLGQHLRRRREGAAGLVPEKRSLDLNSPDFRRLAAFIGLTTLVNLVIGGQLAYNGAHYMDTVKFCGTTCHTVMKPEYTAYQNSPHSRVECVKCHIGPGASYLVKSKIDGLRQVWAVTVNNYDRPIPTPVHTLRPAREVCESCHWPQKFAADRLRVIDSFSDDEQNSRTRSVLLMKLGGGIAGEAARKGVHGAHLGPGITIHYGHADEARQQIPYIEYTNSVTGRSVTYSTGVSKDKVTMRTMDCIDCHNRPSHAYELPERALNKAMDAGQVDPSLPFAKKEGLEILKKDYKTTQEATEQIPAAFETYYKTKYPDLYAKRQADVQKSAKGLLAVYSRNVFPEMNVKWGVYPNNLGHNDFPGCFRCHDESHKNVADSSVTMSQDCNLCHNLLAMDEKDPKILTDLGLSAGGTAVAGGR